MKLTYPKNTFDKDKIMRCDSCRILLTPSMIHRGECAGHKLRIAHHVTLWEWLRLKLGLIR